LRVNDDHWLARARRRPSPNRGPRPDPADISLVVIHGISLPPGRFGTGLVEDLFLNRLDVSADPRLVDLAGVRVSSHLFIDRRGRTTQFVPFSERAWHAGVSCWRGREDCNDFSIGIELEGQDHRAYTRSQYRRLDGVLDALLARYPCLSRSAVVGHQEIAPGRKTDPGPAFAWPQVLGDLW
jgi:AmpD protein